MRAILLTASIACLVLAVVCEGERKDDDLTTSEWVLNAVSNSTNQESPNSATSKLDLTPVGIDTTVDCTTKDDVSGVCVPYYQCNAITKTVIEDGVGLLDTRLTNCNHYLEMCCKRSDIQTNFIKQTANDESNIDMENTANRNEDNAGNEKVPVGAASTITAASTQKKSSIPPCGWSNPGVSPFSFRDQDAGMKDPYSLYGDFPWMVALLKNTGSSGVWSQLDYLGGATLIHPSVVMTVAHKLTKKRDILYKPTELKCRAGEWDTQTDLELYPHQERVVNKFIIHEAYYRTSLYNDIALLFMEKPFQLTNAPHMGLACLASSLPAPGFNCYSMGWGKENDPNNKKKYAQILKKVLLHSVEHDRCQEMLRKNSRLGNLFKLHETLTCANGEVGVDTCRGDGGSPLVCPVTDDPSEARFAVHGMVVYGITCFDPNVPGVYANVGLLKSWVDTKMIQEGYDPKYYTI